MKTLVVVIGGAADRPLEDLGGRTPLEAAATPELDALAATGRMGRVHPTPSSWRPEEGAFALGLFGLDPAAYGDIGGALDAAAFDVPVGSLDQVFRLAFVTADEETIFDPTAGFISKDEALLLLETLSAEVNDPNLAFHVGDGWRNVLLWKGARDVRVETLPPFEVVGRTLRSSLPKGTGIGRLLSAIERSADLLAAHEVNELRRDLGENPASRVWPWGPGVSLPLPDFRARTGIGGAFVGVNPSFLGAARLQGMATTRPEGSNGLPDTNLRAKSEAALKALDDSDFVMLHIDAPAACSFARDFAAKVESLERVDGYVIGVLRRALGEHPDARLVVIAGAATSAQQGRVLADPVPFLLTGQGVRGHTRGGFTEVAARGAGFEIERAHELLDFLLHLAE